MVGAQTRLRTSDAGEVLIGTNTTNDSSAKTDILVNTVRAERECLVNTFGERTVRNWTFAYSNREGRQNDGMAVDMTICNRASVQILDLTATCSDHRALWLDLAGKRERTDTRAQEALRQQPDLEGFLWCVLSRVGATGQCRRSLAQIQEPCHF